MKIELIQNEIENKDEGTKVGYQINIKGTSYHEVGVHIRGSAAEARQAFSALANWFDTYAGAPLNETVLELPPSIEATVP